MADPLLTGLELTGAVHWNDDLVAELPPGAVVLTTSTGAVQSLRLGRRAWGVQFHPEVEARDAELLPAWRGLTEHFARMLSEP